MKKLLNFCLCLAMILSLAACGCRHEWIAANCDTAKTCSLCGEVEGEALGHKWTEADCETAKRCETCGKQEGEALGHKWLNATTEAPKTCENCQKTEGSKIDTDPRFHTPDCQMLFGSWSGESVQDAGVQSGVTIEGEDLTYKMLVTFVFHEDGRMEMQTKIDKDSYLRVMRIISIEESYAALEQQGINRADADAAMMQAYGTDVPGYVDMMLSEISLADLSIGMDGVYYVVGSTLHDSVSWDEEFDASEFTLEGDKLTLISQEVTLELTRDN